MSAFLDQGTISAYIEVIIINLLLSGDNVIVIGMAAAGLVSELRSKAIAVGIAAAAVIRIVIAVIAAKLLAITGIALAGGLMLLWICWTMFRELIASEAEGHSGAADGKVEQKLFRHAIAQIIFADVSMSLDNVLAVAGAAKENMGALVFGLILSVLLMGFASNFVANLLNRYRWIGWVGLAIIVYVALDMVWAGTAQLLALYGTQHVA